MTFIDAINDGRPYKRPKHDFWRVGEHNQICAEVDHTNVLHPTVEDILATDWEVKEEPEPIRMEVSIQARFEMIEKRINKLEKRVDEIHTLRL